MSALLGRYELVRKIAAGGMAEIFLARSYGEGGFFRDVVVKRLFRHLAEHERQLRMFHDEARLLSALAHPNIPQIYDVGFDDGYWYMAMEHVDGMTIADLWRMGARMGVALPLQVALGLVIQSCEALHHAHERKDRAGHPLRIVHRDVTPQNIMVTRDGVAKLMDFGVAQTSARKDTEAGAVRGTFSYMAPEQVRAKPLDKRADVFALGVVLYELTTGTRLFRGSDVEIMTAVVERDVTPPTHLYPEYPPDLEAIVLAALARDRKHRLPSAAHLAWSLEEFAMRHGLIVGPRVVAMHYAAVVPAEVVREESLGIVEPTAASTHLGVDPDNPWQQRRPDALPDLDEQELLDDLQLLAAPIDVDDGGLLTDSLDLDDEVEVMEIDVLIEEEDPDQTSVGKKPLRRDREPSSGRLVLDGFLEPSEVRALSGGPMAPGGSIGTSSEAEGELDDGFMQQLERRLAGDGEEGQ